jgi:hypothetical protein
VTALNPDRSWSIVLAVGYLDRKYDELTILVWPARDDASKIFADNRGVAPTNLQ